MLKTLLNPFAPVLPHHQHNHSKSVATMLVTSHDINFVMGFIKEEEQTSANTTTASLSSQSSCSTISASSSSSSTSASSTIILEDNNVRHYLNLLNERKKKITNSISQITFCFRPRTVM